MKCSSEEFVRIWQQAESTREVCEKTGQTINSATHMASLYRKRGIHLKFMKGEVGRKRLDIEKLSALATTLARSPK